jgi:DNA invertase Pin-like site-specific DNA recombinase
METMLAAADEMYRSQISEDTLIGLKLVAKRGYSLGCRPLVGYRNVRAAAIALATCQMLFATTIRLVDCQLIVNVNKSFRILLKDF